MNAVLDNFDIKATLSGSRLVGLWRLMHGFRLPYFGAVTSLGAAALLKTGTYLLLRVLADRLLPALQGSPSANPVTGLLPWMAAGFVFLAVFEGGFTYISGRLAAYTAEGIARRLRNYLFDHIQRLPFSYHDKMQTGELIQRSTSDVDAMRRFFADQAIGVGRILLLFIVNFVAILSLDTTLGLASVIVIPAIVLVSIFFFRRVTKAYESYQEQDAVLSTTLQENLVGVRVVKAFARQDFERNKFEIDNHRKFVLGRRLLLMHSTFWPLSDIICGAQMLGGFVLAAIFAIDGRITVGAYLAYHGLVVWLIWPMRNLGRLIVQASTGLVSYGRVMEIVRQDRELLEEGKLQAPLQLRGEIAFENVGFHYEQGAEVLEDITFTCQPGQSVALLGSTGSGKTSLVNLLPRFYEYTTGRILLDGVELNQYSRKFLRSQIGIVEQEPFLFSRSLRENITYGVGRAVSQEEIEQAAKVAAIHDIIISFPEQYDTLIGEKGVTLSGGQKQRVAIARTLLKDPRILILDDATSSVDTETEAAIRQALKQLMVGRTSFIIAHRIQSVMHADLILVLDQGRIVEQGTHEELLARGKIYPQIHELQTRIESELEQEIASAERPVPSTDQAE